MENSYIATAFHRINHDDTPSFREKRKERANEIHKAYNSYVALAETYIKKAVQTLDKIEKLEQCQSSTKKIGDDTKRKLPEQFLKLN